MDKEKTKGPHDVIQAALSLHQSIDGMGVRKLVQSCLDMAEAITDSAIGFLHFVNDDEQTIELASWSTQTQKHCFIPKEPERDYPISKAGIWVDCIRLRRPVIHNDYQAMPEKNGLPEGHVPLYRELVLPVIDKDKIVAIMGVGNKKTDYTKDDIDALSLLTRHVWLAIERKRAEEALRESQRRLAMATESAWIGFQEIDLESEAVSWDRISYQIHGYPESETITLSKMKKDIFHPDDLRLLYPLFEKALSSSTTHWKGTFRVRRPDGETRWVDDHHLIIRDAKGKAIRTLGAKIDVTKRKKNDEELAKYRIRLEDMVNEKTRRLKETEQQLYQSQKLEAIGQLAGGIAHDLNNLLTVILGFSESVIESMAPDHPFRDDLTEIHDAGNRAASLTRQLLAFSRRQTLQPKVLNINTIITSMGKMLVRLIGEDVMLTTSLCQDLWPVRVDPGQMEQVIMNLAVNARDAMPQGGSLTLETANATLDEGYAKMHAEFTPGPFVAMTITDTGSGMDHETKEKIFEPFFTTKKKGQGTGLGLSTVYGIVKQSGGHIWLYSEPGMGATFKLYFPKAEGPEDKIEKRPSVKPQSEGGTILVVEDEESLHLLIHRMITKQGYTCIVIKDPEEALGRVKNKEITPDLLITDVIMPKMSGKVLSERILEIHPGIPVLFMSGYTDNTIVRHGVLDEGVHFIQKPFSSHDLAAKIHDVLT